MRYLLILHWSKALAEVAAAVAASKGIDAPVAATVTETAKNIAASMLSGERKAILLGNAAAHHPHASSLLALANWIGQQTGASCWLFNRGWQYRWCAMGWEHSLRKAV